MARLDFASALRQRGDLAAAFAAVTDDPLTVLARAEDKARNAPSREAHNLTLREAAELAWLAACSAVDRAAKQIGDPIPAGRSARDAVLVKLEDRCRMARDTLGWPFESFAHSLHGAYFYGDDKVKQYRVMALIAQVRVFILQVTDAAGRAGSVPQRGRRRK